MALEVRVALRTHTGIPLRRCLCLEPGGLATCLLESQPGRVESKVGTVLVRTAAKVALEAFGEVR